MDSIKKFFANFKKHGTVSRISNNYKSKVRNEGCYSMEAKVSSEENYQEQNEFVDISEFYSQETKNIDNKNEAIDKLINTQECLKEFDEILEEINKDVPKECGSLEEIDDVINSIAEEDLKQSALKINSRKSLNFEIPRFDLQDMIQGLETGNEDIDPINLDKLYDPDDLVLINVSNMEANSQSVQNANTTKESDVISISSDDTEVNIIDLMNEKNNKGTNPKTNNPNTSNYNMIDVELKTKITEQAVHNVNKNKMKENDVLSINPEDSKDSTTNLITEQNIETSKKLTNDKPSNLNNERDEPNLSNGVSRDDSYNKSKDIKLGETENENNIKKNINDKPKTINDENEELETKLLDVKVLEDSDDNYHSSDFEFITEDEAKMGGLIVKLNSEIPKKKVNKLKRVKNRSIDNILGNINSPKVKRICYEKGNVQGNPQLNNYESRDKIGSRRQHFKTLNETRLQENSDFNTPNATTKKNWSKTENFGSDTNLPYRGSLRSFRKVNPEMNNKLCKANNSEIHNIEVQNDSNKVNLEHFQNSLPSETDNANLRSAIQTNTHTNGRSNKSVIEINNIDLKISSSQYDNPKFCNVNAKPSQEDCSQNDTKHRSLLENGPINDLGPRPQDYAGHRNLETPDPTFESLHSFHHRNQNLFIDNNYSENHRLLNRLDHGLFDPNLQPLPSQRLRRLENKSTISSNIMLVEYNGVGFDWQMWQNNESEDDEVKAEANESARKILDMYPGENRRRRRRRF